MADEQKLVRSDAALSRKVDDEWVMFHPGEGKYFALGSVGARIWELLENPVTETEIQERLLAEYSVEPERCRQEVETFVAQLREAQLVTEAAG